MEGDDAEAVQAAVRKGISAEISSVCDDLIANAFHAPLHTAAAFSSFITCADLVVIEKIFAPYICGGKIWHDHIGTGGDGLGANAGLVHRLTLAAATTFDSMPFSSMLNVSMSFLGLSHKDVYKQIVVVQIGATSAATIVGMVIAMILG